MAKIHFLTLENLEAASRFVEMAGDQEQESYSHRHSLITHVFNFMGNLQQLRSEI